MATITSSCLGVRFISILLLIGQYIAGQRVGGGRGGSFFQQRMQSAQKRFNLPRVEHGGGDQQGRSTGRDQRRVGFQFVIQGGLCTLSIVDGCSVFDLVRLVAIRHSCPSAG